MKLTTTLDLLHKAGACTSGYKTLITALGAEYPHEKPIDLLTILDTNGLEDALWALCATAENCDMVARLMAADFAEQVLPIWQKYSKDDRPALAIQAARDFAHGRIYRQEMAAAGDAAWAAARDAAGDAARDAAGAAAGAAARAAARDAAGDAAGDAAWAAARAAAWAAARDAARDAAGAAAWDAAWAAAWAAARDAARQREIFISYLQPDGALDDTR
jgi:hypothetical protein